ncbi:MAG: tetratricopeptide repeat protein, partial [Burkholderiales bacterium]
DAIAPDYALDEPTIRTALQAPIDGGGQTLGPSSSEDAQLLKIPYEALQTGDQLAAWASAQARAGNLQAANQALRAAIAKEPEKKDFLVRLADVLERQGSPDAAKALIIEAQQKGGDDLALLKRDLLKALYLGSPESFQTALPIAQKLLARPDGARDPFVHVWTAAAEGQKYYWLSQNNGAEADKQAARARALAEAKKVVELAPDPKSSTRILLQGMLDPAARGTAAEDNDLESFKNDEDFKRVINGPN